MKRISRNRKLTPEESARYARIRKKVARELPELISRHKERTAGRGPVVSLGDCDFGFAPGELRKLVAEGEADIASGKTYTMAQVRRHFRQRAKHKR